MEKERARLEDAPENRPAPAARPIACALLLAWAGTLLWFGAVIPEAISASAAA
ncbi:MAG: hypothetical protein HUU15_12915, partial [Candidatus Brocadiae bacterium]|nr:hypothetical protein [Candidatus Brocadiia bacterium]